LPPYQEQTLWQLLYFKITLSKALPTSASGTDNKAMQTPLSFIPSKGRYGAESVRKLFIPIPDEGKLSSPYPAKERFTVDIEA